jgi:ribosome-associated protein
LTVLSSEERIRAASKLRTRLTKEGELKLQAQDERTQSRNLALAVERLADLILHALRMPKKRKKTKVPAAARAQRLEKKKKHTAKKKLRRPTGDQD